MITGFPGSNKHLSLRTNIHCIGYELILIVALLNEGGETSRDQPIKMEYTIPAYYQIVFWQVAQEEQPVNGFEVERAIDGNQY